MNHGDASGNQNLRWRRYWSDKEEQHVKSKENNLQGGEKRQYDYSRKDKEFYLG